MASVLTLPTNATIQTRYPYEVQYFFGVDYTSKRLEVEDYRALDSSNFIRRKNCLQKRYGIKQVFDFEKTAKVHNVWSFDDQEGNIHYVANVGGSLYEIDRTNLKFTIIDEVNARNVVLDREVSAFPTNNRLYILGGIKYLLVYYDSELGKLVIENIVGSEYSYIPTTTIGITPSSSSVGGNRQTLDSANLLTYWRKNKLISGTTVSADTQEIVIDSILEYVLDAEISYKDIAELEEMTLDIDFYDNETTQFELDQNSSMRQAHLNAVFCKGINLKGIDETHTEDELIQDANIEGIYILVNYDEGDFNESYKEAIKESVITCDKVGGTSQGFKVYGYINLIGSVVLFNDYNNPNLDNNMTFKFPCYNEETYLSNLIDTCFIGKVYNSNNINSLFVAGNPNYPARDWHSATIGASTLSEEESKVLNVKDLVYFPDTSYCDYGEDNTNPILGYDVLGTGDLLVLKKYQTYEPTIYFRTGQLVVVKNDYGETLTDLVGATLYEPQYSLTTGNIGVSIADYMKIVNYNGDTIFIGSDKKLNGLDKETKSYDNQRYAHTRSYLIDNYLHDIDLTNAFIYEDSDCLYFVVGKTMFVNKYGENATENFMEWYRLDFPYSINCLFKVNSKLYCSTDNGKVFLFRNKGVYYDETFIELIEGELLSAIDTSGIIVPTEKAKRVSVGDTLITDLEAKVKLGTIDVDYSIDLTAKTFKVLNTEIADKLGYEEKIYFNGSELYIRRIAPFEYDIATQTDAVTVSNSNEAYLIKNEFIIKEIDLTNSKVIVEEYEFAENFTSTGFIYHRVNVTCHYTTAPFLFNDEAMIYYKNIWAIKFDTDIEEQNQISVDLIDNAIGYKDNSYIVSTIDNKGFNLANLDFNLINLTQNKVPIKTQTIHKALTKKAYVVLNIFNENDTNAVLSRVSFVYSVGSVIN